MWLNTPVTSTYVQGHITLHFCTEQHIDDNSTSTLWMFCKILHSRLVKHLRFPKILISQVFCEKNLGCTHKDNVALECSEDFWICKKLGFMN